MKKSASAGGTLVKARNATIHAIYPMKGKPKNTSSSDEFDLLENQEMRDLVNAIGVGINGHSSLKNPRYGKVIIAADSDPDGLSIASLVMGMMGKHMTFLLEAEMIYVAYTPLYQQDGKYIFSDNEHELDRNRSFLRYKGLGELSIKDVKHCMIDPATRRLKLITKDGLYEALSILSSTSAKYNLMVSIGVLS